MMLVNLREEHDMLRAIMNEFLAIVRGPLPDNFSAFAKIRLEFSSLFRNHAAAEQNYTRQFLDDAPASLRSLIEEHGRRFNQLYLDYSSHITLWRPDRIREEWYVYGQAVRELQQRLRDLLDWEEAEILPALAVAA